MENSYISPNRHFDPIVLNPEAMILLLKYNWDVRECGWPTEDNVKNMLKNQKNHEHNIKKRERKKFKKVLEELAAKKII